MGMDTYNSITHSLAQAGIVPSVQRIEILEYLSACGFHPTAEQIYGALKERNAHISKATVYNTLHLFAQKGLVRVLAMEDNENRFDIKTRDHGHFICETCGGIADFALDFSRALDPMEDVLKGCKISQKDVYVKGVCAACLKKKF